MKAIILSAGKGERLGQITQTLPKTMINVNGKPILQHNIELCKKYGITDIYINLHHLASIITNHFANGENLGVRINYTMEETLMGTSGAVKNMAKQYPGFDQEPFFIIYGDNYSGYDLNTLIAKSKETDPIASIAFHYREDVSTSGVAEFDKQGKVLSFIEKPKPGETTSHWVNAGIYYVDPSILDYIPDGYSDFAKDIFPELLKKNIPLYGVCENTQVRAFDTPEMLKKNINNANQEGK